MKKDHGNVTEKPSSNNPALNQTTFDDEDFVAVIAHIANFIRNERVRAYNEGFDNGTAHAKPELLEAARAALVLIDDMSRFVGTMALRDYRLFNETPIKLRLAIAKALPLSPHNETDG